MKRKPSHLIALTAVLLVPLGLPSLAQDKPAEAVAQYQGWRYSGSVYILTTASTARKLTYLDSESWSQRNLLRGENGIAALTFCEVPILPPKPLR